MENIFLKIVLQNSRFTNGLLTIMEAAYGLTDDEIEEIERCDEQLLRTENSP